MIFKKLKLTQAQFIAYSFLLLILLGSFLLCLPISSKSGAWTPYIDSLFTSTSATCVTGLVVYDTFTHWSFFGQLVILLLIQIGGLGLMTLVTMLSIAIKRHIGLYERKLLMESAGTLKIAGVVALIKRICAGTFIIEGAGAVLLSFRFIPDMGVAEGIFNAIFHSISSFCNAGFDLMGRFSPFSSLTRYQSDPLVNITVMLLIILGGLGFFVWSDISCNRFHLKNLQLHTKIVLAATASLLLIGFVGFFTLEYNGAFKDLSFGDKIMAACFQSVTPRTAGYNTVNLTELSRGGNILTVVLMFIGGSPGSTAGGIKTTTFFVLVLEAFAYARGKNQVTIFKRRFDFSTLSQASAISTIYLIVCILSCIIICATEPYSLEDTLFEVVSAIGTVGLSKGITPQHGMLTKIILAVLMFFGRLGGLTFALMFAKKKASVPINRPADKIIVG